MNKLILTVVMLFFASAAQAAVNDIKIIPLGYDKGDPNTKEYRFCAGDLTAPTKLVRTKLMPADVITSAAYCLDDGTAYPSAECNSQLNTSGNHLYKCKIYDSDYMKGLPINVSGLSYIDGVSGYKSITNDGLLVWNIMSPGIPRPPVCSVKSCQVCDNGQIICP